MSELLFKDIKSLSNMIANKEISPVDVTKQSLEQIKKLDPVLNAFIKVMSDSALEEASILEKEVMTGQIRGPLHGVPIAVKDLLETKGVETTAGSKVFENWIPSDDATVISKLKEAGAIIIGKANLHEFAMGATTENATFGNCRNPWDVTKIPGGSSGGSAVAVATGMSFGAIGTDTAGSIRLPAAICGITGIKPTYGRVSRKGCLPFSWSLDHIGPMTRSVGDSALMLDIISGYDSSDSSSSKVSAPVDYSPLTSLKGLRLGVIHSHFFEEISPEVEMVVMRAISDLRQLGAEVVDVEVDGLEEVLNSLKLIAQSEVVAFHEPILKKYKHLYGEDLQFRFHFGQDVLATNYINAQRTRKLFLSRFLNKINDLNIDAIVAPTNAIEPFSIGTIPPQEAINNMFTLGRTPFANITGLPALTIPCGFMPSNLPVGLQLIGKPFEESKLFQIGDLYEKTQEWVSKLEENIIYLKTLV
ncbi:amidase [Alkalihalobacillus sp. MEB130]|uniref:amidase n=1 Tax=Alkalihalobacillus sp. MEB130 TaxID=2976704 RepID=UPI0028E007F6|nr:amidase [Alkalihalobacillus sp. MEB130]MDT8860721.1 amidase [Alkalihalobacillus sp. MEB130]